MNLSADEQDSWESYEWLISEKMEQLEYLIRQFYSDFGIVTRRKVTDCEKVVSQLITNRWKEIAKEQAVASKKIGVRRVLDTTNIFGGGEYEVCRHRPKHKDGRSNT